MANWRRIKIKAEQVMSFDRSGVMEKETERTFRSLNYPFRMNKNKKQSLGQLVFH